MRGAAPGLLVLATCLPLVGCGDAIDSEADPASWVRQAEEAFQRGDAHAARARGAAGTNETVVASWDDAVEAWKQAARFYRNAFRLEDPVAERRTVRAMLAFRTARAMSNAGRMRPAARASEGLARDALLWFAQAQDIEPALRQVHYERALIYESEVPGVRDLERARMAYEAYIGTIGDVERVPESEALRVERARERVEALGPQEPK